MKVILGVLAAILGACLYGAAARDVVGSVRTPSGDLGVVRAYHRDAGDIVHPLPLKMSRIAPRVVGGTEVPKIRRYPQVLAWMKMNTETAELTYHCTASVIDRHVVMTAARCIQPEDLGADEIYVVCGGTINLELDTGLCLAVTDAYEPEEYATAAIEDGYDIAIAGVAGDLLTHTKIRRSKIAFKEPINLTPVSLVGFGATEYSVPIDYKMHFVPAVIHSRDTCEWFTFPGYENLPMICAEGSEDSAVCTGDSGAPLLVTKPRKAASAVQVGVMFGGEPSCGTGLPSMYTSLAHLPHKTFFKYVVRGVLGGSWLKRRVVSKEPETGDETGDETTT